MSEAVIVAAGRTAIGRANKGSFIDVRPDDLLALAIGEVLAKVPQLDPGEIEDLIVGCAEPAGEAGFNIARVATTLLGLQVPGVTINRYCSSSLQAIRMAAHAIRAGEGEVFVAAGVEAVSRYQFGSSDTGPQNPLFAAAVARSASRENSEEESWSPSDGLPDIYIAMGQTAENVAQLEGISRQEMDEFALQSQMRAHESESIGFFKHEIIPVTTPSGDVISKDDCPRPGTTLEGLAELKPVFRPNGRVTAGNCCPLNDGAAAVVIMSDAKARDLGIAPLARIVASGVSAINPEIMGLGPIEASHAALRRANMTMSDVDLVEINEAFAAQVIPAARHLGVDSDRLNIHGGAIALGHPFGMTGARIMTTLIHALEDADLTVGLETMCVAGGQGMAMIVERIS